MSLRAGRGARRWFRWILGDDRIEADPCLKINAAVGALALLGGACVLTLRLLGTEVPFPPALVYLQLGFGLAMVAGWPLRRARPERAPRILALQGSLLLLVLIGYPLLMFEMLCRFRADPAAWGGGGFSHAPGLLALGYAYAVRLLADFGLSERLRLALMRAKATLVALVVGGVLDLVVLAMLLGSFFLRPRF